METFNYVCDAGQPNNNMGGWYGKAYASYKCVETGELTKIDDLGTISNNRAELKALIHILWSLAKRHGDGTKDISLIIQCDSKCAIAATKRKSPPKLKDKTLVEAVSKERRIYQELAARFGKIEYRWVPRENIVKVLGH